MLVNTLTETLKDILNIRSDYVVLIIYSIVLYLLYILFIRIFIIINQKMELTEKQIYTNNKRNKTILSIILIFLMVIIWKEQLKSIITLISFISAAITLAARDIIFNYFCGIYIKLTKPIKVEDRIKVNETIGDIVNINALNFELLEVNSENNQSTGIIIHMPNSLIFNSPVKNYNTVFKYVWDELEIRVDINTNIDKAKKLLLDIVEEEETIKEIPKKMKRELNKNSADYRVYYNNLTPIIYTKIVEDTIYLNVRFLVHPKKQRNVESDIYEKILRTFSKEKIILK